MMAKRCLLPQDDSDTVSSDLNTGTGECAAVCSACVSTLGI